MRAFEPSVLVCPDASYVGEEASTIDAARQKMINGKHGDTWREFLKFGQQSRIERNPAHLTAARIVAGEIAIGRFLANTIVDAAAGAGATTANAELKPAEFFGNGRPR